MSSRLAGNRDRQHDHRRRLPDGFIKVQAVTNKTRRTKTACLPPDLYAEVQACSANGWAFGRFSDELHRLLLVWKKQPHHAASVRGR